jgi:hypothetical protein
VRLPVRGASDSRAPPEDAGDDCRLAGVRSLNKTTAAKAPPTTTARTATTARMRPFTTEILRDRLFY